MTRAAREKHAPSSATGRHVAVDTAPKAKKSEAAGEEKPDETREKATPTARMSPATRLSWKTVLKHFPKAFSKLADGLPQSIRCDKRCKWLVCLLRLVKVKRLVLEIDDRIKRNKIKEREK